MAEIRIRPATKEDAEQILRFIRELARFEKAEHEVTATKAEIEKTLFGKEATSRALTCEAEGVPIGYAVYFFNYSTWQGKNGLYLEDLYITPESRNLGAGKKVLKYLCGLALEKGCGRVEWSVLDWNRPAIEFYQSLGAEPQEEWLRYRLSGNTLAAVAGL